MSFFVTGTPRSGTRYLSRLLNLSPTWTVEHEAGDQPADLAAASTRYYEGGAKYGEVSSFHLRHWEELRRWVDHMGVIVRNPADVYLSVVNWFRDDELFGEPEKLALIRDRYRWWFSEIGRVAEEADFIVRFDEMTTQPAIVKAVGETVGIRDLPPLSVADLSPSNNNPVKRIKRVEDLPGVYQDDIAGLQWFRERFFPEKRFVLPEVSPQFFPKG